MSRIARTLVAATLMSGLAATSASAYLLSANCNEGDKHVQVQYRDAEVVEVCYN